MCDSALIVFQKISLNTWRYIRFLLNLTSYQVAVLQGWFQYVSELRDSYVVWWNVSSTIFIVAPCTSQSLLISTPTNAHT